MSEQSIYAFKKGSRLPNERAQEVGEVLESMSSESPLTAEHVVNAARKKKHALHDFFEWDDTLAAEEHRKEQARCLIRSVVVTYIKLESENQEPIRAFITLTKPNDDGSSSYVTTVQALSDEEERKRQLERAKTEAKSWRNRWRHLSELANVFTVLDTEFG